MRLQVLGPLELVADDGTVIGIGSRNQRTVLGVLAARSLASGPGAVVLVESLVEALWGDEAPRSAVSSARTYVSRLRRYLDDALAARAGGYALDLDRIGIDAIDFEGRLGTASSAADLGAALALWRGPAFSDLTGAVEIEAEARRLDERRGAARQLLVERLVAEGRPTEAAAEAESLLTDEPLREGAWTALVEALAAQGRSADALRAVQRAGERLAEAGLVPGASLREAEASVLSGEGAEATMAPRLAPPVPAGSLVGRTVDRDRVAELTRRARVVTLVGPGGVGKTRLALEVAQLVATDREHGAPVVELARISDGDEVPGATADALGMLADGADDVLGRIGGRDLLIVMDNCEHVIDAAAAAVERMVRGGRRVGVLATSRERLGVDGEQVWPVAPLDAAGSEAPAAELFRERAEAVAPGSIRPGADDHLVERVVTRLDGLPLAIEMAAARLATMSLLELVELLDERLDDLRSVRRTGDRRHRTLESVIEWSEDLLGEDQRRTLHQLSVFAGPVEAGAIRSLLGDAAAERWVPSLAARSLVTVERSGQRVRFGMLETVREVAAARLDASGAGQALRRRHLDLHVELAVDADRLLRTVDEASGEASCTAAFDELRRAQAWGREHDPDRSATLVAALTRHSIWTLRTEPQEWAAAHLPRISTGHPQLSQLLVATAHRAINGGDLAAARRAAEWAETAGGRRADVLEVLGDLAMYEGRLDDALDLGRELEAVGAEDGEPLFVAIGRSTQLLSLAYAGHFDAAEQLLDDAPPGGPPTAAGWEAYSRGEVLLDRRPEEALASFARAIELADSVSNRFLSGVALVSSVSLQARVGSPVDASRAFSSVIEHWHTLAARTHQLTTLRNLVTLLVRLGRDEPAARLLHGVADHRLPPTFGAEAERLAAAADRLRERLGPDRWAELEAEPTDGDIDTLARFALAELAAGSG
ncbi:MAG: BTAD domain-containing putative transcriptional regulator [Actinomycetota bacterium]